MRRQRSSQNQRAPLRVNLRGPTECGGNESVTNSFVQTRFQRIGSAVNGFCGSCSVGTGCACCGAPSLFNARKSALCASTSLSDMGPNDISIILFVCANGLAAPYAIGATVENIARRAQFCNPRLIFRFGILHGVTVSPARAAKALRRLANAGRAVAIQRIVRRV